MQCEILWHDGANFCAVVSSRIRLSNQLTAAPDRDGQDVIWMGRQFIVYKQSIQCLSFNSMSIKVIFSEQRFIFKNIARLWFYHLWSPHRPSVSFWDKFIILSQKPSNGHFSAHEILASYSNSDEFVPYFDFGTCHEIEPRNPVAVWQEERARKKSIPAGDFQELRVGL